MTAILLLARCARYDYFGDELYFVSAGRRPAVGYVDQGPLVPMLARAADVIAPHSPAALRIPAIVAAVTAIAVTALTARELGGGRRAQLLAASVFATCPFLVVQAAALSTFAFDATLSAVAVWLLIRWTRTGRDAAVVAAAVVVVVDIQVKLLVAVLLVGLAAGFVFAGPRIVVRRRALWASAGILAVSSAPALWWQSTHGWPQLAMGAVIDQEQQSATGGVAGLPLQIVLLAGLVGVPMALVGCWTLAVESEWRRYRFVVVAVAVQIGFVVAVDGRPYYLAGYLPVLFAAGATRLVGRAGPLSPRAMGRVLITSTAMAAAVALVLVCALPRPDSQLYRPTTDAAELSTRMRVFGTSGWDRLTAAVTNAYRSLPPEQAAHTVVVAQNYWQASALDIMAADPLPVYSANRGFAQFGTPPAAMTSALYVSAGDAESLLRRSFSTVRLLSRLDDPRGFPGIDRSVDLWLCDEPRRPWPQLWSEMTTNTFATGL
ncbi:glycosyltransferase family 39 protein [Nocardia yunnanensis]|uniref:glycosyltransferase family 39 protein n=1 Tax=Nocardia yunnanensis TaxID=2382165 RepID=UPI0013C522F4|nr:glycosyltransferase family 39 protein [Nocardia yunnanensis]